MRKSFYLLMASMLVTLFAVVACDETAEVDLYENWQERNERYLDSIAQVARTNASGEWKVLKSVSLPNDNPNDITGNFDPLNYIYVKVLEEGTSNIAPMYNDTVRVHYRGKLINGTVFDQSYKGTLDIATAVPTKFKVSNVITGWVTALLQMNEGDRWEVYIPWSLAYGPGSMASSSSSMREYSLLYFDMQLTNVYPEDEYTSDNPVPDWN